MRRGVKNLAAIIIVTSAVAACAPAPVKVAPPPIPVAPPPPPPMPLPPGGAAAALAIPPLGADGVRLTPNRFLSPDEQIWHFRSALNVAALNCQGPVWGQIAPQYNKFIDLHKKRLSQASRAVDKEYKARYPDQNGLRVRDTKLTDLYNYFALPPVKAEYCDAALRKVGEVNVVTSAMLPEFSNGALADIDGIFIRFFDAYVKYEQDLAAWNMRYAPNPAPVQFQPQGPVNTAQPSIITPTPVPAPVIRQPVPMPAPSTVPPAQTPTVTGPKAGPSPGRR